MTTVVNNPGDGNDAGIGFIIGIILVIAAIALFFVYGLPALRNNNAPVPEQRSTNINIEVPAQQQPGTTTNSTTTTY